MTIPTYYLHELGPQAQMMAKNCNNDRLAVVMQYVALGSMILMVGFAARELLKDAFGSSRDPDQGRSR
jgi:hypothetical protein